MRLAHHLSQRALARSIGTTQLNVTRWETGKTTPGPYFRLRLCELLDCTAEEIGLPSAADGTERVTKAHFLLDPLLPDPPAVIGRDSLLSSIRQRLRKERGTPLLALYGLPGVGKTTIAAHLAHDSALRGAFPDGTLWARIGPHVTPLDILSRWGTLLETQPHDVTSLEAWTVALRSCIGGRRFLFILDDVWTVRDALSCTIGGSHTATIITTRSVDLAVAFAGDAAIVVRELSDMDGMALLVRLVPMLQAFPDELHALVHSVGGLPLALSILGRYLQRQAYSEQPRRVQHALLTLQHAEARLQMEEPQMETAAPSSVNTYPALSLQSVIAISDDHLTRLAHTALCALSVFPAKPNTFTEEAATAIAAVPVTILDQLCDAGLLEWSGPGRYILHQTIADYARVQLREDGPGERLLQYGVGCVRQHQTNHAHLAQEYSTIKAALDGAVRQARHALGLEIVLGLVPFELARGMFAHANDHLMWAREAALALGDSSALLTTLRLLGVLSKQQGALSQAEQFFHEGLLLSRDRKDRGHLCDFLAHLGWLCLKLGDYAQAQAYSDEGLPLARSLDQPRTLCLLLNVVGGVADEQGRRRHAHAAYGEGLRLACRLEDPELVCIFLLNIGVSYQLYEQFSLAETLWRTGEALARQAHFGELRCVFLNHLGEVARRFHADFARAEQYYQEGLVIAHQRGQPEWQSLLLHNLANVASERGTMAQARGKMAEAQGDWVQAEVYVTNASLLAAQMQHPWMLSVIRETQAAIFIQQHRLVDAEAALSQAYALAASMNPAWIRSELRALRGTLRIAQHRLEEAEALFEEMRTTPPGAVEERLTLGLASFGLARIAAIRGDTSQAQHFASLSLQHLSTQADWCRTVEQWQASLGATEPSERFADHTVECQTDSTN